MPTFPLPPITQLDEWSQLSPYRGPEGSFPITLHQRGCRFGESWESGIQGQRIG